MRTFYSIGYRSEVRETVEQRVLGQQARDAIHRGISDMSAANGLNRNARDVLGDVYVSMFRREIDNQDANRNEGTTTD